MTRRNLYPHAAAARQWLNREARNGTAVPYEADVVFSLSDAEACADVERYYPGGWSGFVAAEVAR